MNILDCYTPGEAMYAKACGFITDIYRDKLHMQITRYPDILFVVSQGEQPLACIGLNESVHNVVFTADREIWDAVQHIEDHDSMGEQYLWASNGYPLGATLVVSALASYASKVGIKNVIFTGTMIAMRSMRAIGAHPILLAPIKETILEQKDRENCEKWFSIYRGTHAYVQPTKEMEELNEKLLQQHQDEVTPGPKLARVFRIEQPALV